MSVSKGVWRNLIIAVAILGAIWLIGALTSDAADLPYHIDLTFTNLADMDRQVDSVLAVCVQKELYSDSALTGYHRLYSGSDTVHFAWYKYQITCRQWAGLTVFEKERWVFPSTGGSGRLIKGHARIYWWEITE